MPDIYSPVYARASEAKKKRVERAWAISNGLNEGKSVQELAEMLKISERRVKTLAFEFGHKTNPQGGGIAVRIVVPERIAKELKRLSRNSGLAVSTIGSRVLKEAVSDAAFFNKYFSKSTLRVKRGVKSKSKRERRVFKAKTKAQSKAFDLARTIAGQLWRI